MRFFFAAYGMPDVRPFGDQEEIQIPVTQLRKIIRRLTHRLGCRDPETLECMETLCDQTARAMEGNGVGVLAFRGCIASALAHMKIKLEARVQTQTRPPIRLRMISTDGMSALSMEVEWEDGSGERDAWSSWKENNSCDWYEAEKILPAHVRNITVHFKVHGVGGNKRDVFKVNRHDGCQWMKVQVSGEFITDTYGPEIISFRADESSRLEPVDAVFELTGFGYQSTHSGACCWISRAWNAARKGERPKPWECWEDESSRPQMEPRLAVLRAADAASSVTSNVESLNALQRFDAANVRLTAAMGKLIQIHRHTLDALRAVDKDFSRQWVAVNSTNTVTAGLAMGASAAMFTAPPVGLGLGIASAATSGVAWVGDREADRRNLTIFKQQMARDVLNTHVVVELEKEWERWRDEAAQLLSSSTLDAVKAKTNNPYSVAFLTPRALPSTGSLDPGQNLTEASTAGTTAGVFTWGGARALGHTNIAGGVACASYLFGAVMATGIALHGWCTTKFGQQEVREKMQELLQKIVDMQKFLARVDQLECPYCLETIHFTQKVQRCSDSLHFFHDSCLRQWAHQSGGEGCGSTCPECACGMVPEVDDLQDFLERDTRRYQTSHDPLA